MVLYRGAWLKSRYRNVAKVKMKVWLSIDKPRSGVQVYETVARERTNAEV